VTYGIYLKVVGKRILFIRVLFWDDVIVMIEKLYVLLFIRDENWWFIDMF